MSRPFSARALRSAWKPNVVDWALLGLFILRLLAVLPIVENPQAAIYPDSNGYLELARGLAHRAEYHAPSIAAIDLLRPPGYPGFLAPFVLTGLPISVAIVSAQLLLSGLASAGLYWSGRALWGRSAGQVACFLTLASPNVLLWSMAVLSDVLFAALLSLAFVSLVLAEQRQRSAWIFAGGLILGAAAMVRPVGLILVLPWAIVAGWFRRGTRDRLRRWHRGFLFLLGAALLLLPWAARNDSKYGYFNISSIGSRNLSRYMAAETLARAERLSLEEARSRIPSNYVPLEGEWRRGLQIILEHPGLYAEIHVRGTLTILFETGQPNLAMILGRGYAGSGVVQLIRQGEFSMALARVGELLRDEQGRILLVVPALGSLHLILLYGLTSVGLVVLAGLEPTSRKFAILALVTAAILIFLPGPVGNARFRVPAEPFLALIAGLGALPVSDFVRRVGRRPAPSQAEKRHVR